MYHIWSIFYSKSNLNIIVVIADVILIFQSVSVWLFLKEKTKIASICIQYSYETSQLIYSWTDKIVLIKNCVNTIKIIYKPLKPFAVDFSYIQIDKIFILKIQETGSHIGTVLL